MAGLATFSLSSRYDPYTTMNVPPSDNEKIAWPSAATMTAGVRSDQRNLSRYQRTPSIEPGNVSDRMVSNMRIVNSAGMMILLAVSMPPRMPFTSTLAQATITAPVQASCRRNDLAANPVAGGRIADTSTGTWTADANWPRP